MNKSFIINNPATFGASIGLTASVAMFMTIPAYHDYIVWAYTPPWLYGVGFLAGIGLGLARK